MLIPSCTTLFSWQDHTTMDNEDLDMRSKLRLLGGKREPHKNIWWYKQTIDAVSHKFQLLVWLEKCKKDRMKTTLLNYMDWTHHHTGILFFLLGEPLWWFKYSVTVGFSQSKTWILYFLVINICRYSVTISSSGPVSWLGVSSVLPVQESLHVRPPHHLSLGPSPHSNNQSL